MHGEHVTVGCGELHVAYVSNQIGWAKSPNKGKGGTALVTATGLREGLEDSCPLRCEAAGIAGSAAALAGDAAYAEGGPRCGQAQQVETGFFDFEVEQVQAFEAGRGPAECMREDFKEQLGLLTQASWGLECAGLKQQQRQRGKRNPRVRLVAAASGEAVEAGTARGAAAPTERQTLFVRIAQQPPVRWIHVFGVLLCLLWVPCGMEVGSHAELVVEELVKPWVTQPRRCGLSVWRRRCQAWSWPSSPAVRVSVRCRPGKPLRKRSPRKRPPRPARKAGRLCGPLTIASTTSSTWPEVQIF